MYQTILFDLDGTLTDSGQGIMNSVSYALDKLGIQEENPEQLRKFIGPPLYESFSNFYQLNPAKTQIAVTYFREYFKEKGIFENQVYPGIPQLLEQLKQAGKTLVLATSKPEIFAKQVLEYFDLDHYFTVIAGASLDSSRISKAQVIAHALSQLPPLDQTFIMVGDREHDVEGAKEHGLATLGVLYGYGSKAELQAAGAKALFETVSDLEAFLMKK